jgi:hypothetical protein
LKPKPFVAGNINESLPSILASPLARFRTAHARRRDYKIWCRWTQGETQRGGLPPLSRLFRRKRGWCCPVRCG